MTSSACRWTNTQTSCMYDCRLASPPSRQGSILIIKTKSVDPLCYTCHVLLMPSSRSRRAMCCCSLHIYHAGASGGSTLLGSDGSVYATRLRLTCRLAAAACTCRMKVHHVLVLQTSRHLDAVQPRIEGSSVLVVVRHKYLISRRDGPCAADASAPDLMLCQCA